MEFKDNEKIELKKIITENVPINCKSFAKLLAAYRAMGLKELENNLLNEYDALLISTDEEVLKKIIFLVKNSAGFTASQSRTFEAIKGLLKETGRI